MLDAIQFSSFSEFLDMGGYAFNVWSVYALFIIFLVVNLLLPIRKKKQILQEQKRRLIVNREMQKNNQGAKGLDNLTDAVGENS
ncbi:MAG: heme exporter protein CcmD [Gammaproteobacteria bacterium]|nr:heme exporter protein CcmD [Gammaproteobacteria bacterium]MDP7455902.1 heme exporter protein CcmD [Gammaproteobacteria bacterium]|tara:strand:- start:138 stop:389 length:252 start_codon:yes stop_codon:yes gene_type:complete